MAMHLTTKGCYGLKAMVELALHHADGQRSVHAIASDLHISRKYLHALLASLKAHGLVHSHQGCQGGYALAFPPSRIRVTDILEALEGPLRLRACVGDPSVCPRSADCATRQLWIEIGREIEASLRRITLGHLAARATGRPPARRSPSGAPAGRRPRPRPALRRTLSSGR